MGPNGIITFMAIQIIERIETLQKDEQEFIFENEIHKTALSLEKRVPNVVFIGIILGFFVAGFWNFLLLPAVILFPIFLLFFEKKITRKDLSKKKDKVQKTFKKYLK